MVRLSCGLEHVDDIIDDVTNALKGCRGGGVADARPQLRQLKSQFVANGTIGAPVCTKVQCQFAEFAR